MLATDPFKKPAKDNESYGADKKVHRRFNVWNKDGIL